MPWKQKETLNIHNWYVHKFDENIITHSSKTARVYCCSGVNSLHLLRREVSYNILIEFGIPMKLFRMTKMCLNEMYNKVRTGKYLSDNFPIQNALKLGDALLPLLFNFALEYVIRRSRKTRWE
jgi:hypothetical protein